MDLAVYFFGSLTIIAVIGIIATLLYKRKVEHQKN
jgi:hypothetical protein